MRFVTCQIGKALLARVFFLCHSLVAIAYTAQVLKDPYWWLLALANVGLFIETAYTLIQRKGEEWRWICPSAVCYLLATVPAICLLELDQLKSHFNTKQNTSTETTSNSTKDDDLSQILATLDLLPIKLDPDLRVEVLTQLLLLFLIIGRWLMPKGKLSRDELSQLLFVYIAIASDIMELFDLFEEERVYRNEALRYSILGVWSVSLFQFTLVLTATRSPKKPRPCTSLIGVEIPVESLESGPQKSDVVCCQVPYVEIMALLISLFIMDGPFLAIRLFTVISLEILSYNILFFTVKNAFMVSLLFYRFFVLLNDIKKRKHIYEDELSISTIKSVLRNGGSLTPDAQKIPAMFSIPSSPHQTNTIDNSPGSFESQQNGEYLKIENEVEKHVRKSHADNSSENSLKSESHGDNEEKTGTKM